MTRYDQLEAFSRDFLKTHYDREGRTGEGAKGMIDISFEGFLKTVHHLHISRARGVKFNLNGHWDTQVPRPMLNYKYDCVAKIEDAPDSIQHFCTLAGLEFSSEKRNSSNYATSSDTYLGKVPAYTFGSRDIHSKSFLNQANRRLINKIFDVDFETFGYLPEN